MNDAPLNTTPKKRIEPTWVSDCGRVTLYLGDCLDILPTLEAGSVDAVVTDPPYGILNVAIGITKAIRKSRRSRAAGKLRNLTISTANFDWDIAAPAKDTFDLIQRISRFQIIWGGNYFELPPTRCVLVWDKMQPWTNFSQVELAWTSLDRPAGLYRFDKSAFAKEHPTQKPLPLMTWCLGYLPDAETICDPFMGGGTTGVACVKTGRRFIGIELGPKYFEIAKRRIKEELYSGLFIQDHGDST